MIFSSYVTVYVWWSVYFELQKKEPLAALIRRCFVYLFPGERYFTQAACIGLLLGWRWFVKRYDMVRTFAVWFFVVVFLSEDCSISLAASPWLVLFSNQRAYLSCMHNLKSSSK